jgi:hypothetical protein
LQKLNKDASMIKHTYYNYLALCGGYVNLRVGDRQACHVDNLTKHKDQKNKMNQVISHCQHLGKTIPNIWCPKHKIAKLNSMFRRNLGMHGFHMYISKRNKVLLNSMW